MERFHVRASWSNITPFVDDTKRADIGAGVALYHGGAENWQRSANPEDITVFMVVPVTLRDGSANPMGENEKYEISGGIVNQEKKESLHDACARKVREEVVGPNGPILHDFENRRLHLLDGAVIYPAGFAEDVHGFRYNLSDEQYERLSSFSDQGLDLTEYTEGRIRRIRSLTLREVLDNPNNLHHDDQMSLFHKLKEHVSKFLVSNSYGFDM